MAAGGLQEVGVGQCGGRRELGRRTPGAGGVGAREVETGEEGRSAGAAPWRGGELREGVAGVWIQGAMRAEELGLGLEFWMGRWLDSIGLRGVNYI